MSIAWASVWAIRWLAHTAVYLRGENQLRLVKGTRLC